ncbi:MAG: M28 family peptidase [Candidatus Limimorpha sp.]
MQRSLLLLFLVWFGFLCRAQQLVLIPVENHRQIESAFSNDNLTIYHYDDECMIATAKDFDQATMLLLDTDAFADGPYYLVHCPVEEQSQFLSREAKHCKVLNVYGNKLIVKSLSESFQPFSRDGMVVVSNIPAKLPMLRHSYPDVKAEDPRIRILINRISDDSLMATVRHLQNYGTRQWDSDSVYAAQNWLVSRYEEKGLSVSLHDIDSFWNISTSDNVIAIQPGLVHPDEFVFCGAHYDSFTCDSLAPGADDNASGTAAILETARILSQYRFERSIVYCAWAAEERGLLGSEAFATHAENSGMDIWAYFNLDMTGYLEEGLPFYIPIVYSPFSDSLASYYKKVCKAYYPDMIVYLSWLPEGGDSDHSSFHRHGYQSIMPFEQYGHSSPYIHSGADTIGLSVNSPFQMRRFAEMNLACVATLAGYIGGASIEETAGNVSIYPNPVEHQLHVQADGIQQIRLYNVYGQLIKAVTLPAQDFTTLDLSDCPSGLYVLSLSTVRGVANRNIVVR